MGAFAAVWFIFAVPPTPFDALDFRSILLPYLVYARESFRALEFPFWNPYSSLGRPFAADPQAIVCWPLGIAYILAGPFWGVLLLAWSHTMLAAWGSARLCLKLGAARAPALCSGFIFVLSGKLTGHYQAGHVQFVFSYLCLPALLFCAVRAQEAVEARRSVAWLGVLSGLQLLVGAPQVYWNCALAVGLFVLGRRLLGSPERSVRGLARDTGRIAVGYALGVALAAVLLIPLAELVQESNRVGIRPEFTAAGSMGWPQWLTALSPLTQPPVIVDWEMLLYPGVLVTLLGLAGLLRGRDRNVRALILLLGATGVIAAGSNTPLYAALLHGLPGFGAFRVHARMGAVLVYTAIISAALLVSDPDRRHRAWQVLAVGAGCLIVIALVPHSLLRSAWPDSSWAVGPCLLVVAGTLVTFAWLKAPEGRGSRALGALAALMLAADLISTDLWLKRTYITARDYSAESDLVVALRETGQLRAGAPPPRVFAPPDLVRANGGMLHGFATFAGSEALALQRVWNYVHWAVGREPPTYSDIYQFSSFAEHGRFPVPWVAQVAAINFSTRQIEVRSQPSPRLWLNGKVRVVSDWREAAGRLAAGHDARAAALLESPLAAAAEPEATGGEGTARITTFTRNTVVVEVDAPAKALLVLAEAWYPGWRARIDGHEQTVMPANGWMRAVSVPAGKTRVEFFYRPTRFFIGLICSCSTALLLAWMLRPVRIPLEPVMHFGV